MKIPDFNEKKRYLTRINKTSQVITVNDTTRQSFDSYIKHFESSGFLALEERESDKVAFTALKKENIGVFINYYYTVNTLTVVMEEDTKYFDFKDEHHTLGAVSPQITQISLEIFGMSYAVRLSDGRFIVIDGGREFEPDATKLYECLKRGSITEKPIIAAWIFTHPHPDHFYCFMTFMEKYSAEVIIEKCMFTFPEHDNTERYPALLDSDKRYSYDTSLYCNIPILHEKLQNNNITVYSPYAGQSYTIGDAKLEILAGIEDTIHLTKIINATSLVIKMDLGGQTILWTGDAIFNRLKFSAKYGTYLKADILQVPHHGCQSGTADAEIEAYRFINPSVCFIPSSGYNIYTSYSPYREAPRFLLRDAGVDEVIAGETERTITLPYTPPQEAKSELERKYLSGLNSNGSVVWIFTGLNTSNKDDFVFTFLNTTYFDANVNVELFFEDKALDVKFIKAIAPRLVIKTISITGEEVDGDALYINFNSLKSLGIPENADFAVRFISDIPIVVSHKSRLPAYTSTYNDK